MNLRSRGASSLVPTVEDIAAFERELVRKRREEEQQSHLQRLGFAMENLPQHEAAQAGNGQGAANLRPQHPQLQARAIGTHDQPNIHGQRAGIRAPAVENNNFEIKSSLINMIQSNKYHGLASEDPLDHLDNFDQLCGTIKINGVSEDAFKLRLFPFSLGDKAHTWEKSLVRDSITTWDECKKAFLTKFFSTSRTAKLRNEISGFHQKNLEGFGEAWERFNSYINQCPHHGFTKESLLSTFYRGALPESRGRLDTASNGFFLGRTQDEAEELIENMAKSDSVYSEDHDRANRGSGGEDQTTQKQMKALKDQLDVLLLEKAKRDQLKSVEEQQQKQVAEIKKVDGLEVQEEVSFIHNNGNWYRKEPNFQYPNNYQQKPLYNNQQSGYQSNQPTQAQGSSSQAPSSNMESMFKQILEGQSKTAKDIGFEFKSIHAKIDANYADLNNKYMQLASHLKALESQVSSMPSSSKNPKESCNVVLSTTSSEMEMSDHEKEVDEIERLVLGADIGKVQRLVMATAEAHIVKKPTKKAEVQIVKKNEPRTEKQAEKRVDHKLKEVEKDDSEVELSPYDKLPFPQRFLTKAQKKVVSKFRKDLSDIGINLPQITNMHAAHVQMMLIKDILDHQAEVAELLDISILKIDPPIPPKSLPKLESNGKFTLSCTLGKITMDDALVDSGASVNVISMDMVKTLGIESMEPDTSSLTFGDSSSTTPIGIIKDFPLKIGSCTIPIDLTVLKMASDKRVPLILGTPFLTTVGACIDFPNKKVTLMNVNKAVSYPLQSPLDVTYCGTITCSEQAVEKPQDIVVVCKKEGLDEELGAEHLESAKEEEVSGASKATYSKKKMVKASHPPPLDKTPHTLTLHPMKLKDGAIEYKIKCKGRSKPFSSARAIITPQLQDDPIKLQELLSHVLTITLEGGKDSSSH